MKPGTIDELFAILKNVDFAEKRKLQARALKIIKKISPEDADTAYFCNLFTGMPLFYCATETLVPEVIIALTNKLNPEDLERKNPTNNKTPLCLLLGKIKDTSDSELCKAALALIDKIEPSCLERKDYHGETAIQYAKRIGNIDIIQAIEARLNKRGKLTRVMEIATTRNNVQLLTPSLKKSFPDGNFSLAQEYPTIQKIPSRSDIFLIKL